MTRTVTKRADTAKRTKAAIVKELLESVDGASLDAICNATGWQPHSSRAFLTGLRKKGREVVRYQNDKGISLYRMTRLEAAKVVA